MFFGVTRKFHYDAWIKTKIKSKMAKSNPRKMFAEWKTCILKAHFNRLHIEDVCVKCIQIWNAENYCEIIEIIIGWICSNLAGYWRCHFVFCRLQSWRLTQRCISIPQRISICSTLHRAQNECNRNWFRFKMKKPFLFHRNQSVVQLSGYQISKMPAMPMHNS